MGHSQNCSFENFMVNGTNHFAYEACKAFAAGGGNNNNLLLIYGESGVGKTHLVWAVANYLEINYPDRKYKCTTADDFSDEVLDIIKSVRSIGELRREYQSVDFFILENVERLIERKLTSEEFLYAIDSLMLQGKGIFLTSNRIPSDMFQEHLELKTKLEEFCAIEINPPDEELIESIMDHMLHDIELHLPEDVKAYVMKCGENRVSKTKGILKMLKLYADIEKGSIHLQDLRRILKDG